VSQALVSADHVCTAVSHYLKAIDLREKIIWNFDNVQKAYATRGYEAKSNRPDRNILSKSI
jgi:hypothetical protein